MPLRRRCAVSSKNDLCPLRSRFHVCGGRWEEGAFSAWLKNDGDRVAAGDPLFALESDKVTMDVESLDGGILHIPSDAPQPGAVVTVGQRIGYLLAEG